MEISRRQSLALGTSVGLAWAAGHGKVLADELAISAAAPAFAPAFAKESDLADRQEIDKLHGGTGSVAVRRFGFAGAPAPTNFVTFDIPPRSSEGVHVHGIGLPTGPFDEYYYIVSGTGVMRIDGEVVPVEAGDHVHTPMGVHHGIENTAASGNLKVLVTFISKA